MLNTKNFARRVISIALFLIALILLMTPPSWAVGNAENGAKLYMKKCWWCHGKEGEADGPGAKFMRPPPRDFSMGVYKYKTSVHTTEIVREEDMFTMIKEGMPGTSMPSWKEIFKDEEIRDLVAHVKTLTDIFEEGGNPAQIGYGAKIASSPESIQKGRKAFEDAKCYECHGQAGKGDTMKKLKEDDGAIVWPRNFTKPWTFRAGWTPEAIFSRVTNGIPNTPMTSFAADKTGSGKLSEEDRWHVVNYVMSLADESKRIIEGDTVITARQIPAIPKDEKDPAWDGIERSNFWLVPQIIAKDRFFTPANDSISVKAVFSGSEVAFLLEWDDRSNSVPGDKAAEGIAISALTPDAIAIQMPVEFRDSSEKPYFGHGDTSNPASMLYWNAGSVDKPNVSKMITSTGLGGAREESDAAAAGFSVSASYETGTWKVMMRRKLESPNKDKDTQFEVGTYMPISFANWDGSNGESGSKHTLTTWYWLLLAPETGSDTVVYPGAVFILLVVGQFLISAAIRKK
ncbi:MAG: c-type cytochrome [Nitrospinota bacterium]